MKLFLAAGRGSRTYNDIRINKCLIEINKNYYLKAY